MALPADKVQRAIQAALRSPPSAGLTAIFMSSAFLGDKFSDISPNWNFNTKSFWAVPRKHAHPVYERVRRVHKEELRRRANDPEQVRQLRHSIDAKVANWRREWEERWDAKRARDGGDCASSATNFYYGPGRCLYPR